MGQQIWETEGLPVNCDTVKSVIKNFKKNGIKSERSKQYLALFIKKVSDNILLEMYDTDADATLEMLVECFGVRVAFDKINKAAGLMSGMKFMDMETYAKVTAKYEERIKKANEEKDIILSDYTRAEWKAEEAENQIRELKETLAHYKADLYDFYAQAGKVPNYERG